MLGRWRDWLSLLRPHQWGKNALVGAGYLFAGKYKTGTALSDLGLVVGGFTVFCLLSGSVYAVNDVCDKEKDRQHPGKRHRPVASRRVSEREAIALAVISGLMGLGIAVGLAWLQR